MQKTAIEYLTHTWNPFKMRCSRVSPGCENCWHLRMADRMGENPKLDGDVREAMRGDRGAVHSWDRLKEPLALAKPAMIGVQFMGDLFALDSKWIDDAFQIMNEASWHTFIVLTKRIGRAYDYFQAIGMGSGVKNVNPLPNVWIGATVENQEMADERIPLLLMTPARIRFISVEPMLGPVDLNRIRPKYFMGIKARMNGLNWVICGAETGPRKRPMDHQWYLDLAGQCVEAGIPFYGKVDSKGIPLAPREYPFDRRP